MAFGQELKDFVASFKTGYDMLAGKDEREYNRLRTEALQLQVDEAKDPLNREIKEAELAHRRALTSNIGRTAPESAIDVANKQSLISYRDAQTAKLQREMQGDPNAALILDAARGAFGGGGGGQQEQPTQALPFAPEGEGDRVEARWRTPALDAADAMATGAEIPQAPGSGAFSMDSPALAPGNDYMALAFDAIEGGLEAAASHAGVTPAAIDDGTANAESSRAYLQGKGAAPINLVIELEKIVDPNGEMAPSERRMRTLGFLWQQYSHLGDEEKAKNAAGQLLATYRAAAQQYEAFAMAAAEAGDIDQAAQLAMQAYSYVPDGRDLKIVKTDDGKYAYQFTDTSGEVVEKGIMSPKELAASVMNVSPAGDFDGFLAQAAGAQAKKGDGPGDAFAMAMAGLDKGQEASAAQLAEMSKDEQDRYFKAREGIGMERRGPAQLAEIDTAVRDALDDFQASAGEAGELPPYIQDVLPDVRMAAYGAMLETKNLSAAQAVDVVTSMLDVNPDKPMEPPFKVYKTGKEGFVKITLPGNPEVVIPEHQYQRIGAAWAAAAQERAVQLGKEQARSERDQGVLDTLSDAVGQIKPGVPEWMQQPPNLPAIDLGYKGGKPPPSRSGHPLKGR